MCRSRAISFNPFQNASSRLTLVLWPPTTIERLKTRDLTPFVLNSTAQLFPLRALGAARIHRPSIQYSGVVLRSCPPEYPGPLTSSILGGSTGTAIFFRPIRNCRAVSPVCHTAGQADSLIPPVRDQ